MCIKQVDIMSNIGKLPLAKLELYTLLVYFGIKDAYLVDCCCLDKTQAKSVLRHVVNKYALKSDTLITIVLDNDILFANRSVLTNKITRLENGKNYPVVVDVSDELRVIENPETQMKYLHSVFSVFLHMDANIEDFVVHATEDLHGVVGLPFIAGWLLGYPSLYRAERCEEPTHLSEDSTVINLLKMSICATVQVHNVVISDKSKKGQSKKVAASAPPVLSPQTVEILGFSIPERLWESSPDVRSYLQATFDGIVEDMRSRAELLHKSGHVCLAVCSIEAGQEVHTLPKLAL